VTWTRSRPPYRFMSHPHLNAEAIQSTTKGQLVQLTSPGCVGAVGVVGAVAVP
jgi:hypothetical protein